MNLLLNGALSLLLAFNISLLDQPINVTHAPDEEISQIDSEDADTTESEEESRNEVPTIREFEWEEGCKLYDLTYNGYVFSHILMYGDGSYEILSPAEKQYIISSRVAQGTSLNNANSSSINIDMFMKEYNRDLYDSYEDENEAKYELYQEINALAISDKYPNLTKEDMQTFIYDGEVWHCFEIAGQWFKLSPSQYDQFIHGYTSIYDDAEAVNRGFGSGQLILTVQLGESLLPLEGQNGTEESVLVELINETNDSIFLIVNPPSYTYYADLDMGSYRVKSVTSYEYPDYPLLFETEQSEFSIGENVDNYIDLYVYRQQDEMEIEEISNEEIEATILDGEMEYQQYLDSISENESESVSQNDIPVTDKSPSIFFRLTIAGFVIILVLGTALYLIKKKEANDY